MKQINELFSPNELSKDQRLLKRSSDNAPRPYKRDKYKPYTPIEKKVFNPEEYRFRLVIFFKNRIEEPGYRGTWVKSIDKYKDFIDEFEGLKKLERRIKHNYKGLYTRAIIYMNVNGAFDYPVTHFFEGEELQSVSNLPLIRVPFKCEGKNNFVNLKNEKLLNEINRFKRAKKINQKKR